MNLFCRILTILLFTFASWARDPNVQIESQRLEANQQAHMTAQKATKVVPARPTSSPTGQNVPKVPKPTKVATEQSSEAPVEQVMAVQPEQTPVPEWTSSVKESVRSEKPSAPKTEAERDGSAKVEARKQDDMKPRSAEQIERLKNLIELVEKHKAAENEVIEAEKKMAMAEEELMIGITGLIIEETMTKIGYDFYEYFYLLWEAPGEISIKDYNIYISERASPMWGSWVQVRVDERIVWNSVLRPRSTEIEDAAKEAITATKEYLVNYEQYQFKTNDMFGTGIY
jgi:curli production assembly/transport component CsgE